MLASGDWRGPGRWDYRRGSVSRDLIVVDGLEKEFRLGFARKRVRAVRGISFSVKQGDIFGFLGPNGAGKTTTLKMLTGLIRPSAGSATLFGHPIPSPKAMRQIGFLPENPYVYPYLTPTEFVEMCGRLSGLSGKAVRDRCRQVLERVGILYAADRPARRLSKGMLQRTGLAAALVADPELLILDEPMSGLDPVGRKEVKDLLIEERSQGRTIFFSTHILSDVETLCDDVVILRRGEIVVRGRLDELLRHEAKRTSVVLVDEQELMDEFCRAAGHRVERVGPRLHVDVEGRAEVQPLLERALAERVEIEQVLPRHETLEELFVREAIAGPEQRAAS
ncbi:MAG: ABC transporter ATP-binding protein [Myxococcales bacterium]|nr:ABC transporter ATP-binding protein [Myxococcales bacterium]